MDKNISSRDGEPGLTQNSQPHRKVDQNEGLLAEAVVANPDDFRKRSRRRANVNSPDRGEELLNRQENSARGPCFGARTWKWPSCHAELDRIRLGQVR